MRLTLIDLFINQALIAAAVLSSAPLARALGLDGALAIVAVGCVLIPAVWTLGASFIYQRLHIFPLVAPVCPHCNARPSEYTLTGAPDWPRFNLRCGACERETEVVTDRRATAVTPGGLPLLQLQWPEFLGRWRRIR